MKTARCGDVVDVNYVKRFVDGTTITSSKRGPTRVTVGVDHPRMPGLGMALEGMAVGATTVKRFEQQAYGQPNSAKVHKLHRSRFEASAELGIGRWVRVRSRNGKMCLVRVLDVDADMIFVETHHRWDAHLVELKVELLAIV